MDYCTVDELRDRLGLTGTTDDTTLEGVIAAASRIVEGETGRRFGQYSETRYYTPECGEWLPIDDLVSVTTLQTDYGQRTYPYTWDSDDYDLEPANAAAELKPYTSVITSPVGVYSFPEDISRGVKIIGTFGWPVVPAQAKELTLLLSEQLFKRRDAPFGISGGPDMGEVTMFLRNNLRSDPHLRALIDGLRRLAVGAV